MAHKGVLLVNEPGKEMPEKAYLALLASKPNQVGYCVAADGILNIDFRAPFNHADFSELLKSFSDHRTLSYIAEYDKGFPKEDHQPYVMLRNPDEKADPLICVFIEGDFSDVKKPKQTGTAETILFDEHINPLFDEYCNNTDKPSVKDFFAWLDDPATVTSIQSLIKTRGVIAFYSHQGDFRMFERNALAYKGDWGYMSQASGYSDVTAPASGRAKFFKTEGTASTSAKKEEAAPVQGASQPSAVRSATTEAVAEGKVRVRPVQGLDNRTKQNFYSELIGMTPGKDSPGGGWKQGVYIDVNVTPKLLDKHKAGQVECANAMMKALLDSALAEYSKSELKSSTATPPAVTNGKAPTTNEEIAQIPAGQLKAFDEVLLKNPAMAKVSQEMGLPTLEQIKAWEEKYSTFEEKTAYPLSKLALWPHWGRALLARDCYALAGLALTSALHENIRLKREILQLQAKYATEVKPEEPAKPEGRAKFFKTA